MALRRVELALTEEALRLLYATHADFTAIPRHSRSGRIHGRSTSKWGSYDFSQVRAQSHFLRIVSIVEAYVDACCGHLFDLKVEGHDIFVRNLAAAAREQASGSWDERKKAFIDYHGVPLGGCAKYSDIDAFVQVRNAVAHGLGHLTSRQGEKDRDKMKLIGVSFRDRALIIDEKALDRCVKSSAAFISDVDRQLPR